MTWSNARTASADAAVTSSPRASICIRQPSCRTRAPPARLTMGQPPGSWFPRQVHASTGTAFRANSSIPTGEDRTACGPCPVRALQRRERDRRESPPHHAELAGGGGGQIDDPALGIQAVGDHDDDRSVGSADGDPQSGSERQTGMGGREIILVEPCSAGGPPPLERRAII